MVIDNKRRDYVWCNGDREENFGHNMVAARKYQQQHGEGKVWERVWDTLGYLEGVTDVTTPRLHK